MLDGQSGITDLNYALNVPGGSLEFTSGTDDPFVGSTTVSRGMVGNTVVGGRIAAVSSNAGENNSESDLGVFHFAYQNFSTKSGVQVLSDKLRSSYLVMSKPQSG